MATYSLQELLNRWKQGTLTIEQAIGQILQHLAAQEKQNRKPNSNKPPQPPPQDNVSAF